MRRYSFHGNDGRRIFFDQALHGAHRYALAFSGYKERVQVLG